VPITTEIALLKYRHTKIVATLGPSSSDADTIERLVHAGVDVFRLNMSHGTHETHRAVYRRVCEVANKTGRRPTAVLVDLSGPKIRVGRFTGGQMSLERVREVTVTTRDVVGGDGNRRDTSCPRSPRRHGDRKRRIRRLSLVKTRPRAKSMTYRSRLVTNI